MSSASGTKQLDAWRLVVGVYPGWSPDVEVWARASDTDRVELVALDPPKDMCASIGRSTWRRYEVDLRGAREEHGEIYGGRIVAEENVAAAEWQSLGLSKLTLPENPIDPASRFRSWVLAAAHGASLEDRKASAERAREAFAAFERAANDGALDAYYPDHSSVLEDLATGLAALRDAERALAAHKSATPQL